MRRHPLISRRKLLKASASVALTSSLLGASGSARAGADFRNTQAPGFFRFKLGSFEVTMLTDGMNQTPLRFSASNIPEDELLAYLKANKLPTDRRLSHLNVCLINTGEHLVLVDAGSGDNFIETAGKLSQSLEASGYSREDVDAVIITHGHPDHIWGIIDDFEEEPRFPNASYFINPTEWDYWTASDLDTRLPEGFKFFATGAQRNLMPIAEMTSRSKPGTTILPGITTLATPGHTLGHMSVIAESGSQKLMVVGDAITHPLISLEHPEWQPQMDMDKETAVTTRRKLIDMAATDDFIVASYHIPFPGVGRIARHGTSHRWVPLTWTWQL